MTIATRFPTDDVRADDRALRVAGVSKRFGSAEILDDISLAVSPGEVLALVGPSGAGKTTLCRIVAGLEVPTQGSVHLDGQDITDKAPGARRIALMFESYALYPHLSVRENILSPLKARLKGPALVEAGKRLEGLLSLLEVSHLADRQPVALSGGQKQRIALARALVQDPSVLMLDEPISHLDAKLRHKLRGEVRRMLLGRRHPSIWSTPDGIEALSVGDRIAVIHSGRVEQVGTPEDIWLRPASIKVAKLFGDPPTNVLAGELARENGALFFSRPDLRIALPRDPSNAPANGSVYLGLKPGNIAINDAGGSHHASVYSFEAFGKHAIVTVMLDGGDILKIKTKDPTAYEIGSRISFDIATDERLLFDGGAGTLLSA